jgi:exportin-1
MEALLDFSLPFSVATFDQVVAIFIDPSHPQRAVAERVLNAFREHPDSWTRVDTILAASQSPQARYAAMQVLENVVKFRWKLLPSAQRDGIRAYLVQKIIALSQDERVLRAESMLVSKLNLVLVQVCHVYEPLVRMLYDSHCPGLF